MFWLQNGSRRAVVAEFKGLRCLKSGVLGVLSLLYGGYKTKGLNTSNVLLCIRKIFLMR